MSYFIKTTDIISCLDLLFRIILADDLKVVHLRVFSENGEEIFGLYCESGNDEKFSTKLNITAYESDDEKEVIV
jgi:hypothetical protein